MTKPFVLSPSEASNMDTQPRSEMLDAILDILHGVISKVVESEPPLYEVTDEFVPEATLDRDPLALDSDGKLYCLSYIQCNDSSFIPTRLQMNLSLNRRKIVAMVGVCPCYESLRTALKRCLF